MTIESHDERESPCRMLGHPVPFGYCRRVADGLPCRKVLDCWHERFDVVAFVREHYTPQQLETALAPPAPKIVTLVDLVRRAQGMRDGGEGGRNPTA